MSATYKVRRTSSSSTSSSSPVFLQPDSALSGVETLVAESVSGESEGFVTDSAIIKPAFIEVISQFVGEKLGIYLLYLWKLKKKTVGNVDGKNLRPFTGSGIDIGLFSGDEKKSLCTGTARICQIVKNLLIPMGQQMRIRESELVEGLVLLERFLVKGFPEFRLTMDNLAMAFTVCVMLANKSCADSTFQNCSWCKVFGMKQSYLNQSEEYALRILDFQLLISGEEIEELIKAVKRG